MADAMRTMSLAVHPGLYVLRYLSSLDPRTAPVALVKPSSGCACDIDIVDAPGRRGGQLAGPGGSLVILSRRAGSVVVSVEALPGFSNLDAKLSLDLLATAHESQGDGVPAGSWSASPGNAAFPENAAFPGNAAGSGVSVEVLGHVKWRGDIAPDAEGWIGGPQAPSAIEGVQFRCAGADVGIAAQCRSTLDRGRWSPWGAPGNFAGSRQMASPITALRLKLTGSEAARFQIQAEALFLGAPTLVERGPEVEVGAPGGTDPLVGLRVTLVAVAAAREPDPMRPSRVRVFR